MKKEKRKPPRIGEWFLRISLPYQAGFTAAGDYEEIFHRIAVQEGFSGALRWYWYQVGRSIVPFLLISIVWSIIMFKNYLRITLRNMRRYKAFSFINIAGLAIGLACCILIFLWVQDEMSYDKFHKNYDNIYRIMTYGTKYFITGFDGTPAPLAPALENEVPELVDLVRFASHTRLLFNYKDKAFYEVRGIIADPSLFTVFSFPFIKGNPETSFTKATDIVITEAMAEKYFGDEDPMGKTMEVEGIPVTVTGVMANIPRNSHLKFDFINSFEFIKDLSGYGRSWGSFNFVTYVQLHGNSNIQATAKKITEIAKANNCPQVLDGAWFQLQPLSSIHLDPRGGYRSYNELGDMRYVYTFSIIALFVLLIACINFMNLSTARSSVRSKEVGLRKTVGAYRTNLIKQFLGESLFLAFVAFILAMVLVYLALPVFNNLSGKELSVNYMDFRIITGLLGIIFVTGIIAGSYPALFLSSFEPVKVLKGKAESSTKGSFFRKTLVLVQFSLSLLFIIGTVIAYKQLHFIQNRKLGFNKENIVWIPVKENIGKRYEMVKNELLQDPNILSVTAQDYLQAISINRTTAYNWEGKAPDHNQDMLVSRVDYDFFETLNLKILEGRSFSKEYATDASQAFIVNEEAVRKMKIEKPVGKFFSFYNKKGVIVGVVNDANFRSLHVEIEPHVFHVLTDLSGYTARGVILIKVNGEKTQDALSVIRKIWKEVNPVSPFEYHFLDETYDNLYNSEKKLRTIINYFTFLAICISCLGLFGLASFTAERRTKEIGIRKVLGASSPGLLFLLSKEFTKWVLVANIIAWPIGYYVMNKALQDFAYRITIGIDVFLFSGLLALLIALLTVSFQSFRAARTNPVKALRYE